MEPYLKDYHVTVRHKMRLQDMGSGPQELTMRQQNSDNNYRTCEPAMDVVFGDGEMVIQVDLPGIAREEIDISAADRRLLVSGDKRRPRGDGERCLLLEREYGCFSRAVELPPGAQVERAEAVLRDGVLRIVIPLVKT
jgi:HSP20 family protein